MRLLVFTVLSRLDLDLKKRKNIIDRLLEWKRIHWKIRQSWHWAIEKKKENYSSWMGKNVRKGEKWTISWARLSGNWSILDTKWWIWSAENISTAADLVHPNTLRANVFAHVTRIKWKAISWRVNKMHCIVHTLLPYCWWKSDQL